jgi:hypothetical protein
VQLDDIVEGKAGGLVEIVDILGDDGRYFSLPVEARKGAVAAARPGCGKLRLHGKAPPPGFRVHGGARLEGIERDRLVCGPQAAGGTKVGYAAFGGNAGAGERHDDLRRCDQRAEPCDSGLQIVRNHVFLIFAQGQTACSGRPPCAQRKGQP